jgi:hypothetical protein
MKKSIKKFEVKEIHNANALKGGTGRDELKNTVHRFKAGSELSLKVE